MRIFENYFQICLCIDIFTSLTPHLDSERLLNSELLHTNNYITKTRYKQYKFLISHYFSSISITIFYLRIYLKMFELKLLDKKVEKSN